MRPEGTTVDVKDTVPVKPLTGERVIVEVAERPAEKLRLVGVALTVKLGISVTETLTIAECDSEPLAPVTVTVKLPSVLPVHESVEV